MRNVLGNRDTNTEAEAPSKTLGGCKASKLHTECGEETAQGHQVKEVWSQAHVVPQARPWHGTHAEQRQGQADIRGQEPTRLCPFICLCHAESLVHPCPLKSALM